MFTPPEFTAKITGFVRPTYHVGIASIVPLVGIDNYLVLFKIVASP
jgi:hypothetical protein